MSWFNASQLSSFAKQALSTAQKSIDRVLDIKEEEQWGDTPLPTYHDLPSKAVSTGGWGMNEWDAPAEESIKVASPSSLAITTPVTRVLLDESENFFSAFLPPGELPAGKKSPVVSVPPTKSQRRPQEEEDDVQDDGSEVAAEEEPAADVVSLEPTVTADVPQTETVASEGTEAAPPAGLDSAESPEDPEPGRPSEPPPEPPKDGVAESKDSKPEDRQSDTPSPPVSAFSSGTSTTSDIEVLDHESVLSESSASSRQETGEAKAGLHLMQGSFQLLSASACADFPRLEDFPKLTESCGSSSDAFERIDSFSVQSLDSRSASEVNSDDEVPGGRTLASLTSGVPAEDARADSVKDQSLDENDMEESGRSSTPVNCEQPEEEELISGEAGEALTPPITEEMKGVSTCQILELQKIIDELTRRLETREGQLLSVSKDKAGLDELCDNLKDEIISLKDEASSVQSLKEEFTQRIAEAERKAQLACKERDIAKKEIKGLRDELSTRFNSNETLELIREKEEQIRELLDEGEKLSKQQLQHSNIIKKLRAKEKESDARMAKDGKKVKDQEDELRHLQQVLDGKEELEKQHRDNIKKLNGVVERQEKDVSRLQGELEELQEKSRSLQAALDNSYRELAELHKVNATKDSEAQEAALSREVQAKEELGVALEKATEESRIQQEALANQVADLRVALQRAEQQQAKKEDYLREEISELQQRLQAAETRNQELSQSVTTATRPLLRQIENLQATLGSQTASWEKLEKSISDRLADAQAQLAVAVEKERASTEDLQAMKTQVVSLESQNSLLRQDKGRLQGELDGEKSKREDLEDCNSREHVELENLRSAHSRAVEEAKKEKVLLTNQLEMEKMKVEQEKKKCYLAQEALKEKERKTTLMCDPPASSTPTLSRSSSLSGGDHTTLSQQEDSLDHTFGTMTMSISGTNLYEAARLSGGSSILENLQSQLKLREGENSQLQFEIASLERSRSVMAEELVRLTNQNDEMEEKVKEIPKLRVQLKDLEQRHNTILQMYGEKAEEAEELRLDLEDVKNMYKTQIDELLKNQK
ncbi:TATA element modulatory factor [Denticeps clupeoides]|uniref:TATA element modulatory factor 1 TATA binding domain-containing protein n=1 Tax=Denticeps clupeoides TaxID=299321 RepID=A0AAY4CWZ3_9TELE|nr:TATA element modulatory factor [Denticeps clupeoides]